MSNRLKTPQRRPARAKRARTELLRDAWLARVVSRAIAEVSQATDQEYQSFGLDRDDLLTRLRALRECIGITRRHPSAPLTVTTAARLAPAGVAG